MTNEQEIDMCMATDGLLYETTLQHKVYLICSSLQNQSSIKMDGDCT